MDSKSRIIRAVWMSYEAVKETLAAIKTSSQSDNNTKASDTDLHDKMESVDFVLSITFMKNIMIKSKQMTKALQAENLNVVDTMTIIMATVENLKRINDDEKTMDDEIQAGIVFAKKLGGNPEAEFSRKHRVKRPPRRIDDNPNTQAELSIFQFYLRKFKKVLDTQVVQFGDNLTLQYLQAVKPLATVLQPQLKQPNLEDISELVKLFLSKMFVDSVVLQAEFHNFVSYVDLTKTKLKSLAEAAKFLEVCKSAFSLTNRAFRLLMTAPVTVARDDRTFSRLKIIKTHLRTTMKDARLESLMLFPARS